MLRLNEILDIQRMRQSLGISPIGSFCDRPSLYDMANRPCKDDRPSGREAYDYSGGIGSGKLGDTWWIPFSSYPTGELLWYPIRHSLDESPEHIKATLPSYKK